MSQNISSFPIGTIYYQSGYGVPTHIAIKGCTYTDVTTGVQYINKDGLVDWERFVNNNDASLVIGTISATSINTVDYIVFNTGTTIPITEAGTIFFNNTEKSLAYNTSLNELVTVNMGQQLFSRVNNSSGAQIIKGSVVAITGTTNGLPSVILARNNHAIGSPRPIGLAAENIPNNSDGLIINNGILSGITINTFTNGTTLYLSDTTPGGYVGSTSSLAFSARTNEIGYVLETGTTTGKIYVNINNEDSNLTLTDIERNILEGNVISTGCYEFTGLTKTSNTTFDIAPLKGWIVQNTYDKATLPDVMNIIYSGGTGLTTPYLNITNSTYVMITSAATVNLLSSPPTPQQRRENIFIGKVIHPDKTIIQNVNNTVDYDVSPMSAIRDLFTSIKLINDGITISPNGANMSFNQSHGNLWGNGIGWYTNQLNPNSVTISANTPTTFQYRTQTGGTFSNTTTIDNLYYDVNGVRTLIPGNNGSQLVRATNHRVYLFPTGLVRVQYGQNWYESLTDAIAAIQSESFVEYINNKENGILIGIVSATRSCTALNNPTTAKISFVSKFGELFGGTGGLSTTTLQQAYDNSTTPEIVINSTLDGLTIQNGTGNADNVTRLLEGIDAAGNATSFIRADGDISGTTIQTNSFLSNSTGLTQSSGFTILSNLSTLNAVNDAGAAGLGVPLYGLYRNGNVVQIRIT